MESEKEKEKEREEEVIPAQEEDATTETATTPPVETEDESETVPPVENEEPETVPEEEPVEKMLTQSQVNELVGRARQEGRESALREIYGRYGVSGEDEFGEVFGRGQAYYDLEDEFESQSGNIRELQAENALLKTRVSPERWEDIKYILGGKGMDVTEENIMAEIPSHPEWRGQEQQQLVQQTPQQQQLVQPRLKKLGGDANESVDESESEEDEMMRLFGLKK